MIDYKTITNPSETNTKLDECESEEEVDVTLYKQIVDSLRCL